MHAVGVQLLREVDIVVHDERYPMLPADRLYGPRVLLEPRARKFLFTELHHGRTTEDRLLDSHGQCLCFGGRRLLQAVPIGDRI